MAKNKFPQRIAVTIDNNGTGPEPEQGQNAMLERLCRKHELNEYELTASPDGVRWEPSPGKLALSALRELLQAVQERDAAECLSSRGCPHYHICHRRDAERIKSQTYADLFPEEK